MARKRCWWLQIAKVSWKKYNWKYGSQRFYIKLIICCKTVYLILSLSSLQSDTLTLTNICDNNDRLSNNGSVLVSVVILSLHKQIQ